MSQLQSSGGVLSNVPSSPKSAGYSFVYLPDGTVVFVPPPLTRAAEIVPEDEGSKVVVTYMKKTDGRYTATEIDVMRSGNASGYRKIAALVVEIDRRMEEIMNILADAGCEVPLDDVD